MVLEAARFMSPAYAAFTAFCRFFIRLDVGFSMYEKNSAMAFLSASRSNPLCARFFIR